MKRLIAGIALALLIASPVSARAQASIAGPDGASFGESAGVTFDAGKAKVDPDNWWARVDCYLNDSTIGASSFESGLVYAEYLYLGSRTYVVNDELMTFGPTVSWSGGGADCTVELLAYDGNGGFRSYATDSFEVLP